MRNYNYAKLIDKCTIEYATIPITIDGIDHFTTDPSEYGYKQLIKTETPIEEGYYFVPTYTETENNIIQSWEKREISVEQKVSQLKQQLADTDYKAIKYAEGWISEEDYALIREERQNIRNKINELEN